MSESGTALSTVFTPEHKTIEKLFVEKVVNLLTSGQGELSQYGVQKLYSSVSEALTIELPDGQKIDISLRKPM